MTNQMKTFLKIALASSFVAVVVAVVALFVGGFGYLYSASYIFLAVALLVFAVMFVMYLNMKSNERAFKRQIAYYKLLKELRNKAVLDFYNKFGIKPQYNKDGKLMTPDELLGILTALDKEGKLDPSIYERLGILPKFDKDGKEIPIILVLKHLIRSIKVQGVQDVTKLKGLYAKGTKQEKKEEKETKKAPAKKEKGKKEKGGGKKEKKSFKGIESKQESKIQPEKRPKFSKPQEKPKAKAKEEPKVEVKPQVPPVITKIDKADIDQSNDDYLKKMYARRANETPKPDQPTKVPSHAEYGECTPE